MITNSRVRRAGVAESTEAEGVLGISGVTARTSLGHGVAPVVDAMLAAHDGAESLKSPVSASIDDFDIREEVGVKGTRTLDRATALALSAVGTLMREVDGSLPDCAGGTALILGTTMGSVASTIRFTQDGLSGRRPYLVDPARFPNTVMNFAAGQVAIKHSLAGPNATIAAGGVTGLAAIRYASRMIRGGQAEAVLVGATEECSPERTALLRAAGSVGEASEGSAVLLLGGSVLNDRRLGSSIRCIITAFARLSSRQDDAIESVLRRSLAAGAKPPGYIVMANGGTLLEKLHNRMGEVTPATDIPVLRLEDTMGDLGSVSSVLAVGVAAQLNAGLEASEARDVWVLASDKNGYFGVCVVSRT